MLIHPIHTSAVPVVGIHLVLFRTKEKKHTFQKLCQKHTICMHPATIPSGDSDITVHRLGGCSQIHEKDSVNSCHCDLQHGKSLCEKGLNQQEESSNPILESIMSSCYMKQNRFPVKSWGMRGFQAYLGQAQIYYTQTKWADKVGLSIFIQHFILWKLLIV